MLFNTFFYLKLKLKLKIDIKTCTFKNFEEILKTWRKIVTNQPQCDSLSIIFINNKIVLIIVVNQQYDQLLLYFT